ncbi:MAG: helix-turn-helix domain-containing protein, partial [Spirochaetales bacterium]|nr:helix-turn-helix domain-containing protein [Spirochaetales bacterium]
LGIDSVGSDIILSYSGGDIVFNLGDEKDVDLDNDGNPDISFTVNDIDINAKTAVLKMASIKSAAGNISQVKGSPVPEPGLSNVESRNRRVSVILESPTADPFVLKVVFRGYTLVRYLVDRNERVEQYFDKGEAFRLDVNREVMLWISNSGSFKAKISGVDVNLGAPGEVSAHIIKWTRIPDSGRYKLELIPVY